MTDQAPKGALADVKTGLKVTVFLLLLVGGSGLNVLVAKLTSVPGDVEKIAKVLALTLPLSVWVALTVYVFLATHWPGISQFILAVISLVALTALGNWIGVGTGVSLGGLWELARGRWQDLFGLLVTDYFLYYGPATFFSALIVGGFLGFAAWRLLDSRPPAR